MNVRENVKLIINDTYMIVFTFHNLLKFPDMTLIIKMILSRKFKLYSPFNLPNLYEFIAVINYVGISLRFQPAISGRLADYHIGLELITRTFLTILFVQNPRHHTHISIRSELNVHCVIFIRITQKRLTRKCVRQCFHRVHHTSETSITSLQDNKRPS